MQRNTIETVMGAVVLAVAAFFLYFAYSTSTLDTSDGTTYRAKFDSIAGLVVGGDVRIGGVKVGAIVDLDISPDTYMAEARFTVRKDIKLPMDSSAEIQSTGLLGNNFLSVLPGADEAFLGDGDEIIYTQSAVNIIDMIGRAVFNGSDSSSSDDEASSDNAG